jgi:hypothetical protein
MFACYVLLILYFASKGGYKVQHLARSKDTTEDSGEEYTGGVPGPVEA